jgi:antirestriction protein ArdC
MPNRPRLQHGATTAITRGHRPEAYYSTGSDAVVMPRREAFDSPEFYYSVVFHELTHYADFRIMPRGHTNVLAVTY